MSREPCPILMLRRGYSDFRVAERTGLSMIQVGVLRRRLFPETNAPRSGAMERGAELSADASPTHAAAEAGG